MAAYGFTPTAGTVFGIIIAVVFVLVLACIIAWFARQRYHDRNKAREANRHDETELAVRNYNSRRDARKAPVLPMPTFDTPAPAPTTQRLGGYGGFDAPPTRKGDSLDLRNPYHATYPAEEKQSNHAASHNHPREGRLDDRWGCQNNEQGESSRPLTRNENRQQMNGELGRPRERPREQQRDEEQPAQLDRQNSRLAKLVRSDVPAMTLTPSTPDVCPEEEQAEDKRREDIRKGKRWEEGQ
ncbi:hypothetical protein ACHAQA_005173 [Verticillium albo-atrum]